MARAFGRVRVLKVVGSGIRTLAEGWSVSTRVMALLLENPAMHW